MKPGAVTAYKVFSLIVILGVLGAVALRAYLVRAENTRFAEQRFEEIERTVSEAAGRASDVAASIESSLDEQLTPATRTDFLAVFTAENGLEYLWARNGNVLGPEVGSLGDPSEVPQPPVNSLTQSRFSASVGGVTGTFFAEAVFRVLSAEDLFPLVRDSLVVLAAFIIVTIIVLIARKDEAVGAPEAADAGARAGDAGAHAADAGAHAGDASEVESQPAPAQPSGSKSRASASSAATPPLFSPDSGLGFSEHLERRLSLELQRAAENEQDLSLLVVRFPGASRGTAGYRDAADLIASHFGFADLAFEHDSDSFSVVLINSDLNDAVRRAESFQTAARPRGIISGAPLFGISARNGRLVSGQRLIREAQHALAKTDASKGSTIIGFRPDPQKYRAHVSRRA
jgi:hypothetical protein